MLKDSPCWNCTRRKVTSDYNCHSDCLEYKKYKDELMSLPQDNRNEIYAAYIANAIYKKRKKKNEKNNR